MTIEKTTLEVCDLLRETGLFIRNQINKFSKENIEVKDRNSFVTYVDKESEKMLVDKLGKIIPSSTFIAEEGTVTTGISEFTWIIDPLDGTTNYIHHLPVFSISVALLHNQEIVSGVVYEINNKECFYTSKGGPAFLNGRQIRVSSAKTLEDSLLATGFPYYDYSRMDQYMGLFRALMHKTRGIRRMGSAAADLAYVACGRFDGFFEYGLQPWDVAAGAFLVQQAGGKTCTFACEDDFIFGREIVADNGLIHQEFMELIAEFFG